MSEIYLQKIGNGLMPHDSEGESVLSKIKTGDLVKCKITNPRNVKFFRKWFSLLKVGYEHWEPVYTDEHPTWGEPEKNFERFRKDITILCGYYDRVVRTNGDVVVEAQSVSFGSMTEDEFSKLYDKTISVLLNNLYKDTDMDEDTLRDLAQKYLEYA